MKILVTGATGQQGGAVVRALDTNEHTVLGMTREPATADLPMGVEAVKGHFDDPASLRKAANGVDVVFLMSTPYEEGPEEETKQATRAMDAFKEAGVDHIVYTSVASADRDTGVSFFDSKRKAEKHLESLGIDYTIVAPVFFRENLLDENMVPNLDEGTLALALPADTPLQTIDLEEIGAFNALVINSPEDFVGKRIDIASTATTPQAMAKAISAATGQTVTYEEIPLEELEEQNPAFASMFRFFQDPGYDVDIDALRGNFTEVPWKDFQTWAQNQEWPIAVQR